MTVVEREIAGYGPSGRNGGWVSFGVSGSPSVYARAHGRDAVARGQRATQTAVDEIGAVAAREGIDCGFLKSGALIVATSEPQRQRLVASYQSVRDWGGSDDDEQLLTPEQAAEHARVSGCIAAAYSPHAARVDPARLVRGLADACERMGVTIHERTPALEIAPGRVRCPGGELRATSVLRATESYTTQLPGERLRYLPLYSLMIATEPLAPAVWEELGWRDGLLVGDRHHLFFYAQRTIDGRIAIGGRGAPYRLRDPISERNERSAAVRTRLVRALRRALPGRRPGRDHPPLGRAAGGAARLEHGHRLRPRQRARLGGRLLRPRRGGGQHRRPHAGRPGAGARQRPGVAALGRPPQPPLGARAAAVPGIAGDRARARGGRRTRGRERPPGRPHAPAYAADAAPLRRPRRAPARWYICTIRPSANGDSMLDVIVVGGGFAGVTAARESALHGAQVLLLEARERLGGRTWTAPWRDHRIEYGGGWVHWHQPHTFSEITRAGLGVELSGDPDRTAWYVGEQRRSGSIRERDEIANRGLDCSSWTASSCRCRTPTTRCSRATGWPPWMRSRSPSESSSWSWTTSSTMCWWAELESLAHGPLEDAGAVSVLRWHALSGYSLALTQYTGGRVTLTDGTVGLLTAIAAQASFATRLATPVAAVRQRDGAVEVETRQGELLLAARVVVAVPLNTLDAIEFTPALSDTKREGIALGQASRGIKIFIEAEGEQVSQNAIRPGHPFGYLDTEFACADGSQVMIGFGADAERCDASDLRAVQGQLDQIIPGYRARAATAHDWLADEFSQGTWAIHRPGWYTRYHAEMRRPEGRVLLAGSDLANGWAGFIDGAIESGLRAGSWVRSAR